MSKADIEDVVQMLRQQAEALQEDQSFTGRLNTKEKDQLQSNIEHLSNVKALIMQ